MRVLPETAWEAFNEGTGVCRDYALNQLPKLRWHEKIIPQRKETRIQWFSRSVRRHCYNLANNLRFREFSQSLDCFKPIDFR
jgi:hypothetical protein